VLDRQLGAAGGLLQENLKPRIRAALREPARSPRLDYANVWLKLQSLAEDDAAERAEFATDRRIDFGGLPVISKWPLEFSQAS